MKKIVLSLLALLLCMGSYAQQGDSLFVYGKGKVLRSFLRSKVDSITYSKVGVDDKTYSDYVTQVINVAGSVYNDALSSIDSLKFSSKAGEDMTPGQLVDLGLSVKWAGWNVGANAPEEYGGYYAWGETEEKSDYTWKTYKYYDSTKGSCIDIGSNISGTQYDVAHVKWGGNWRMPTLDEIKELHDKCNSEWTTYKGVKGRKFTGPNGNSIFLPAAGWRYGTDVNYRGKSCYYWSASLYQSHSISAYYLIFGSGYADWLSDNRVSGLSVRPVSE